MSLWPPIAPGRHALVWLAMALLPAFGVTAFVARAHHAEQKHLASDWTARGEDALRAKRPDAAVNAFRTALTFNRDDRVLRLRLAQSLMAAGRASEARAHLITLWEDQPGNGPVNLELGRLAASDGDVTTALRHYHNAIEGAWPDSAEARRRGARLELARFLVDAHATPQAQAELIALSADPPPEPDARKTIGSLLLEAGLPQQALPVYRAVLAASPRDAQAAAGAGRAAFALQNNALARTYLARAIANDVPDPDVAALLGVVRLEDTLDPFARRLPRAARLARTDRALDAAAARLACLGTTATAVALATELSAMRAGLRADGAERETTDDAMDLVLRVEQATAETCEAPQPIDRALRRIVERRQGAGG